jgi:hypothetical protein
VNGKEVEVTFDIDLAAVSQVYEALTQPVPARGRDLAGVHLKPPRTVLHFYIGGIDEIRSRRLRVRRRRDRLIISLESKHVLREDRLSIEKEERTEIPNMPLADAAVLLARGTKVTSSFIKNQHRMILESEFGLLKASLDQMLPFRADRPAVLMSPFWHLEFEEINSWPLAHFLQSVLFRENFADLRPLQESKWRTAALGSPAPLKAMSSRRLREYFDELLARGADESDWPGPR